MIKTFIFDLGNVIVAFNHNKIVEKLQCVCRQSSDEIFARAISSKLVQDYNLGKISSAEFFDSVIRGLELEMNFADFCQIWNCTFEFEPIIPERIIKKLSKCSRLLILSDTNELHFDFIKENFPILNYFDDFVLSHKVGAVKPSEEIFRRVIERAECLPEECVFIDDIEKNVEAAKRLGLNAFQFISVEQLEAELKARNLVWKTISEFSFIPDKAVTDFGSKHFSVNNLGISEKWKVEGNRFYCSLTHHFWLITFHLFRIFYIFT